MQVLFFKLVRDNNGGSLGWTLELSSIHFIPFDLASKKTKNKTNSTKQVQF